MRIRNLFLLFLSTVVFFGTVSLPVYDDSACGGMACLEDGDSSFAAVTAAPEEPRRASSGEVLPLKTVAGTHYPSAIEHPPRHSL